MTKAPVLSSLRQRIITRWVFVSLGASLAILGAVLALDPGLAEADSMLKRHLPELILMTIGIFLLGAVLPIFFALRSSEQSTAFYNAVLDALDEGLPMLAINDRGELTYWNKAMEDLTGQPASRMLGKGNYEYALPFYGERRPVLIDLALRWDEELAQEYLFVETLPDGELYAASYHPNLKGGVHCAISARKIVNSSGRVLGAVGLVKAISTDESVVSGAKSGRTFATALDLSIHRLAVVEGVGDIIQDGLIYFDADKRIFSANGAALDLFGYRGERLIGKDLDELFHFDLSDPDQLHTVTERIGVRRSGEKFPIRVRVTKSKLSDISEPFIASIRDLSESREQEARIRELQQLLSLETLQAIDIGIATFDQERNLVWANKVYQSFYALPEELMRPGTPGIAQIRHFVATGIYGPGDPQEQIQAAEARLNSSEAIRRDLTFPDGRIIELRFLALSVGRMIILTDVSEFRAHEDALRDQDPVTGLPMRKALERQTRALFQKILKNSSEGIGIRLQIDRLGLINEVHGAAIGNRVVKRVTQRIADVLPEDAVFGRAGSNEFVISAEATDSRAFAEQLSSSIAAQFRRPVKLHNSGDPNLDESVFVTLSQGLVRYPQDSRRLLDLVKMSHSAMTTASAAGGDVALFCGEKASKSSAATTLDLLRLSQELKTAIEQEQLFVEYQPQLKAQDADLRGCEALVRWQHPHRGLVAPDEFIPVAESTGLIVPLGRWVLRTACEQAKEWQDQGLPRLVMAVNASAIEIQSRSYAEGVQEILAATGLDPSLLEIEITETALGENPEFVRANLEALKEIGVRLAIDDFGTGYSSLAQLAQLRFDSLKIDQVFVGQLQQGKEELVRGIMQIAHSLEMTVTAEGVETDQQLGLLRVMGCESLQGYLLSRPLASEAFSDFVTSYAQQASQIEARGRNRLSVATAAFNSFRSLERIFLEYRDKRPELDLVVTVGQSSRCRSSFNIGEVSLAVFTVPGHLEGPRDLWPLRAWWSDICWAGIPSLLKDPKAPLQLIGDLGGSVFQSAMIEGARKLGREAEVVFVSNSFESHQLALRKGFGISAIPAYETQLEKSLFSGRDGVQILDPDEFNLPKIEDGLEIGIYAHPIENGPARIAQLELIDECSSFFDSLGLDRTLSSDLYDRAGNAA